MNIVLEQIKTFAEQAHGDWPAFLGIAGEVQRGSEESLDDAFQGQFFAADTTFEFDVVSGVTSWRHTPTAREASGTQTTGAW